MLTSGRLYNASEDGRSQDFTLGTIEAPRGLGRGCPPNPFEGLGERRERPQLGLGQSPDRQRIFGIFEAYRILLVERTVLLY